MVVWIIEPRDPLIVRDGRPFDPTPGARAYSLVFPFPSTVAGGIRTHSARDSEGKFQHGEIERVKQIEIVGPLLTRLDDSGEIAEWYLPAPKDALWLESDQRDRATLKRLVPLSPPPDAKTDLPDNLCLVGMQSPDPRKPMPSAPRFWKWDRMKQWLENPSEGDNDPTQFGLSELLRDTRFHVSINPESLTAREGALFMTQGLVFTEPRTLDRLALAVATNAGNLREGITPLGGERRLVFWHRSQQSLPECPNTVRERIVRDCHCRLILITPAYFEAGWKPKWLLECTIGVTISLVAIAMSRYQVVSGWDLEKRQPKPTRRLMPAGTVLYLKLEGESTAIQKWIDQVWMRCVSDDEQMRRDGFGLAVLGTWDGEPKPIEWRS